MIRPLRQRHRLIFIVLAIVLPLLFICGLLYRQSVPAVRRIPDQWQTTPQPVRGTVP